LRRPREHLPGVIAVPSPAGRLDYRHRCTGNSTLPRRNGKGGMRPHPFLFLATTPLPLQRQPTTRTLPTATRADDGLAGWGDLLFGGESTSTISTSTSQRKPDWGRGGRTFEFLESGTNTALRGCRAFYCWRVPVGRNKTIFSYFSGSLAMISSHGATAAVLS